MVGRRFKVRSSVTRTWPKRWDCLEPPWEDTPGEMWGSLSGGVLPGEDKDHGWKNRMKKEASLRSRTEKWVEGEGV